MSKDLYNWTAGGAEITDCGHEGPNVFEFGGKAWMITDEWHGLGVYESEDYANWKKNGIILFEGGDRPCDGVMANHADVVVKGDEAYIFYFTHPYLRNEDRLQSGFVLGEDHARACIQAARLTITDGKLCCDRNEDFDFKL